MIHEIQTAGDVTFVQKAVEVIVERIQKAQKDHGSCMMGLSGGSTPRPVYEALGKRKDIDWKNVTIFLIDERCTSPDEQDSNQRMIRETLLKHASIPEQRIYFPDTMLPPQECADEYSMDLHKMIDQRLPDLMILGMGDDGHIASLFPPLSDLALNEERLVLHTTTDRFSVRDRITVSLNFIHSAPLQVFLLKGEGKKKVWNDMLQSTEDERRWPVKRLLQHEQDEIIVILG